MSDTSPPQSIGLPRLKSISEDVMGKLADPQLRERLEFQDYHGFSKARLPPEDLASILVPLGLSADDVQIEVGRVSRDLTVQVHHHDDASAYIITLGQKSGYPDPKNAYAYLNNGWRPLQEGDRIRIAAGVQHGFTVAQGGELYFLTVQSPAIARAQGADDYVLHTPMPLEGNIRPRNFPRNETSRA